MADRLDFRDPILCNRVRGPIAFEISSVLAVCHRCSRRIPQRCSEGIDKIASHEVQSRDVRTIGDARPEYPNLGR